MICHIDEVRRWMVFVNGLDTQELDVLRLETTFGKRMETYLSVVG